MDNSKIGITFRLDVEVARVLMRVAQVASRPVDDVVEIALATYIVSHEMAPPAAAIAHTIESANRDPRLQDKPPPKMMTAAETARYLKLSPKTLEAYRTKGTGPKFTRGRTASSPVMYAVADVDDWMDSRAVDAAAWVTTDAAANARGVAVGSVLKAVKSGALKARKEGGRLYVSRASVEAWDIKPRAKRTRKTAKPAKVAKRGKGKRGDGR